MEAAYEATVPPRVWKDHMDSTRAAVLAFLKRIEPSDGQCDAGERAAYNAQWAGKTDGAVIAEMFIAMRDALIKESLEEGK